jgi:outer membrane protein TolC
MTAAVPGGITAEQVGARAQQTSYAARASEETLASASARADAAWTNYIPRVDLTARYTRLSEFTPPPLSLGGSGSLVVTQAPPGTLNPTPTIAAGTSSAGFPLVLDQYLAQATIALPISDYFLRITQGYTAATQAEEAARYDVIAARAKSYSDGKIAYYTWLRARGALVVAQQSLAVAQAHQKDAENLFAVGNASKADVLRAQTAVAAAELGVERGKNGVLITEKQIRIAIHGKEDEVLQPGDSLDGALPPVQGNLKQLVATAHHQRPEMKSIEKNAESARKLASVARAGKWPSLSGFGDVTYANPNPRRFPQQQEWFPTWAVGAQVTWSPNSFLAAGPNGNDAEARANALEAQKLVIRDGIELEVTQSYQSVLEADVAVGTTQRQLEAALEGYRVARELFNAGRGTSTTLIDAETALAQARFDHLNARVDARLARIRLDHAVGRDVKAAP